MKKRWISLILMLTLILFVSGCGVMDDDDDDDNNNQNSQVINPTGNDNDGQIPVDVDYSLRPVLFIHGFSGSASQFESQAQRFMANGYPLRYLEAFEYDTTSIDVVTAQMEETIARINDTIDKLLFVSGKDQIDLIGHSLGTYVSARFLSAPENAARVAHYVNVDGATAENLPGGVPTLALWGIGDPAREIGEAQNEYDDTQSHIQICTSAESFELMYQFFNGKTPVIRRVPEAVTDFVYIAGKVNIFPENIGAQGASLSIYEVDPTTGFRVEDAPLISQYIGSDGSWGPIEVDKGVTYEFALTREAVAEATHLFYREPFMTHDFFIRFNTARPGEGLANQLTNSPDHTILMIGRDKEMWGDQGPNNDSLVVNGTEVITPEAAALSHRLSALFLSDEPPALASDLSTPIAAVHQSAFISGLDLYIPATMPPDNTIAITLTPRDGGGATQTVNVPNWPSSDVRTVSVQFRDFIQ